ncbi:unnamed protein product [Peniophora sp. CBMAI 1063]|nr:unnamed protein product [Peniophora sp. CBMAI 1063]
MSAHLARRRLATVVPGYVRQAQTSSSVSAGGVSDPGAYCREIVKKQDQEGFMMSHLWPRHAQGAYFALKAFYVELATVQESVSNAMLGSMRMQFWRDAVKSISEGRPPQHPIALALHAASRRSNLHSYHLKRIIDARTSELETPSFITLDQLTSHAESTSSTLNYLLLSSLHPSLSASETLSHAASHLGVAQSLSVRLRALPFHAGKGRMALPADVSARHGVREGEVYEKGGEAKGLRDAVFEVATLANDHLLTARSMFKDAGGKVPKEAMPVFAAGVPVANFLQRLEKADFDAFAGSVQAKPGWKLPYRLWRYSQTREF